MNDLSATSQPTPHPPTYFPFPDLIRDALLPNLSSLPKNNTITGLITTCMLSDSPLSVVIFTQQLQREITRVLHRHKFNFINTVTCYV